MAREVECLDAQEGERERKRGAGQGGTEPGVAVWTSRQVASLCRRTGTACTQKEKKTEGGEERATSSVRGSGSGRAWLNEGVSAVTAVMTEKRVRAARASCERQRAGENGRRE
eukprot:394508-Pleurochrysis_carterae.AAC.1